MILAVILAPEEFEGRPQLGLLATSLVFIIPGIILIYFGNKARKNRKNKNDKEYIQKSITKKSTEVKVDKKSSPIEYPIIQKQRKVKTNSRKEIILLINEIVTYADSIPSKIGEQELRLAKLTKYGHDFISDIESAIRSSIQIGNPEYIYVNAGLLCEAIGKMKGANAFTILSNLLTSETDIQEYKYIRIGAIRGLMQLGNKRAITLLKELKDPNIPESTINEAIQFFEIHIRSHKMSDENSQLLFAKQLMDNVEFANDAGLKKLLEIINTGSERVVNGTSYAPGAFATWKHIVSQRPELFSAAVMSELEKLDKEGEGYGQQAAQYVKSFLKK
ncbi:MAG: HEAT repeat domain-containing protein [Ignavibacteriales bacterium]|nr:HEAT repeat domain-containing protein [Ignavibacteriales bacterium]